MMRAEVGYAIISGLACSLVFSVFFITVFSPGIAISFGTTAGVTCGVFTFIIFNSNKVRQQIELQSLDKKSLIYYGEANYMVGGQAIGGKLYLLTDRLQFRPHKFSMKLKERICIQIHSIEEVDLFNVFGFVPNGLALTTSDGGINKFVVYNRKVWKEFILDIIRVNG